MAIWKESFIPFDVEISVDFLEYNVQKSQKLQSWEGSI